MTSGPTAKDERPAVDRLFRSILKTSELGRYLTCYTAGTVIHRYGEPCSGVLIVTQGAVRVSQPLDDGRYRTLTIVRSGGAVGLTSSLSEAPCRYTALAETQVEGYFVPNELIKQRLQENPEAYLLLVKLLSSSLQDAYACLRASRSQQSNAVSTEYA